MTIDQPGPLATIHDLLAGAAADGTTTADAEELTSKAASLLAQHGLDRARLSAADPEADPLDDRLIDLDNPWATVQAYLLAHVAEVMRCRAIEVDRRGPGSRLHLFGYASDLQRTEILFTSLRTQMTRALARQQVPATGASVRAWRRSWLLGWAIATAARVKAAEALAEKAEADDTELAPLLRDRVLAVRHRAAAAYPHARTTRATITGTGGGQGTHGN